MATNKLTADERLNFFRKFELIEEFKKEATANNDTIGLSELWKIYWDTNNEAWSKGLFGIRTT